MNVNVTKIERLSNGIIQFYNGADVIDSFSITSSVSVLFENNLAKSISFVSNVKTLSFNVYNIQSVYGATSNKIYSSGIDPSDTGSAYISRLYDIYAFIISDVIQGCCPGPTFVGGVVASYPNYASFPATGQESVIYIDESMNQAYFWDGSSYQLLTSTGVETYPNYASFPATGQANIIYVDLSVPETFIWDGASYISLNGGSITWGSITGTLSAQTDLQTALNAKFDDPTGTTSQYIRGDGSLATFPSLTGYVPYTGATANVDLGEYELKAGQLSLDTSPTGTASVGTTQWNNSTGISQTTLKGGSVVLKNGVDLVARVVNKVTPNTTLTKAAYQAVRVSGAAGQRLAVEFAQANNDNNSADTIGLVTETIPTNQEGFIMTVGNLEEINTTGSLQGETWADGDVLYLSPTTPGALTNIKPNGSTGHIVVMGYVEYAHAIHGKIYVKIMNGWELDELHNVYINSPTTWQVLRYNGTSQLWVNDSLTASILPSGIDASKIGAGTVDNTEFGYLDGVTSSIQTQLNAKQDTLVSGTNIKTLEGQSLLGSGNIDLNKSDVGLSNVDNTSDLNKPISTATQTALNAKQDTLVSGTNIKTLEGQSLLGSGNIDLTKSDVGLANVDNTSDLNKPISTATQTALNAKENTITAGTTAQYYRGDKTFQTLDKTAVGLSNVDNTSDLNKPISTATQTALNLKQNTLSLTTTGTSGPATLVGSTLNIPQYSGGGGGVTQIVAGTNITISPAGGTGAVTINASGGGGSSTDAIAYAIALG